jgi:DNA-binding response OmpR family regulator
VRGIRLGNRRFGGAGVLILAAGWAAALFRHGKPSRWAAAALAAPPSQPFEADNRFFDLLAFLMGHRGRVFSRDQLLEQVWGYDFAGDTRTVDVHVRWLREKVELDPSNPELIETVRGVGYRFKGQG